MLRSEIINRSIQVISERGGEFSTDEVAQVALALYPQELEEYKGLLFRAALKREITNRLKSMSGNDPDAEMEQISLDGVGRIPTFIQYLSNESKTATFVAAMDARLPQVRAWLALKDRHLRYAKARQDEAKRLLAFMTAVSGGDERMTLRECLDEVGRDAA